MPRKEGIAYLDDRDHSRDNLGCDVGAGPCVRTITESENKIYNDETLAHSSVAEPDLDPESCAFFTRGSGSEVGFFPALGSRIKPIFPQSRVNIFEPYLSSLSIDSNLLYFCTCSIKIEQFTESAPRIRKGKKSVSRIRSGSRDNHLGSAILVHSFIYLIIVIIMPKYTNILQR